MLFHSQPRTAVHVASISDKGSSQSETTKEQESANLFAPPANSFNTLNYPELWSQEHSLQTNKKPENLQTVVSTVLIEYTTDKLQSS